MSINIISSKIKSMPENQKSELLTMLICVCGDRFQSLQYVPIEGFDVGKLSNRFLGSDEKGYLACVVDAIQITEAKGTNKSVRLCDLSYSSVVANPLRIGVSGSIDYNDVIASWGGNSEDDSIFDDEEYVDESDYSEFDDGDEYADESDYSEFDDDSSGADIIEVEKEDGIEVVGTEDDEEDDTPPRNLDEETLRLELKRALGTYINVLVKSVKKRYDLLFESGYDLERPYGLVVEDGVIYTDSDKVLKLRNIPDKDMDYVTSINLYDMFEKKASCIMRNARSYQDIAEVMLEGYNCGNKGKLVYLPYKLLEYAYGRKAYNKDKGTDSNVYSYATKNINGSVKGISSNWKYFGEKVEDDIRITIEDSVVLYCLNTLNTGYSLDGILSVLREPVKLKEIQGYISYVADSLSVCMLLVDYKSSSGAPVSIRLRVSDPRGAMKSEMMSEIITTCFSGNSGGSDGRTLKSSLNPKDSDELRVFEYAHEFNHSLSNAMPLFAYKAYEKLKERGEDISYDSLILGQCTDGTILRNGTHGVALSNKLFHYINAGSRSGKGVMTLNMLVGALLSDKAIFYLDDKPDMTSILMQLSGGEVGGNDLGPTMFCINGTDYRDDNQKQFTKQDKWINKLHIPMEAVALFGDPTWSVYGEIFYLRAFTLAFGIIMARGLDGGYGRKDDPNFNGHNGIYLVCDEVNMMQTQFDKICKIIADKIPLQSRKFSSMADALEAAYTTANSDSARKGSDLKFGNMRREFEAAFNASKFYALSYLNSLSDNIAYIHERSLSGFLKVETKYSDVLVIGQNLEQVPISLETIKSATSSGRLSSESSATGGLGGTQIAKDVKGDRSIPFAHFVFSSADAIIGFNDSHKEYLAQEDTTSNAYGRLDASAGNFCYIPSFVISENSAPSSQLTKELANDSKSVYFKPYLILNDNTKGYTDQMYERLALSGITEYDLIKEYPDSSGSNLNPCVGFPEYMKLIGVPDLQKRLRKGAEIANYVVEKYLGYKDDGSGRPLWLQFVTDLRPEWLLSVRDVASMCTGMLQDSNKNKGVNNPITKEYYAYLKYVKDHEYLGIVDNYISNEDSYYVDEEGEVQVDVSGYESKARRDFNAKDDFSNIMQEEANFTERMRESLGDTKGFEDDDEIPDMFGSFDDDSEEIPDMFGSFDDDDLGVMSVDTHEVNGIDEKDALISSLISKLKDNDIDVSDYVLNAMKVGVDCGYTRSEQREEYSYSDMQDIVFDSCDDEAASSFASLMKIITSKVIKAFGGYDRITSVSVVGGALVINGTVYRSKMAKDCVGYLPLDIRRRISSGNVADLFNYGDMLKMSNLRELSFDSRAFVFDYVAPELGYIKSLGVNNFFDDFKLLQHLKIGPNGFHRVTYKRQIEGNDIFYYRSMASKYATICDKNLSKFTKKSWNFTKNMFKSDKGLVLKTVGILAGGAVSATAGVATLGAKAVKSVSSKVDSKRRSFDSMVSGLSSLKDGIKDLFKD